MYSANLIAHSVESGQVKYYGRYVYDISIDIEMELLSLWNLCVRCNLNNSVLLYLIISSVNNCQNS
jgi:hypothetical protein